MDVHHYSKAAGIYCYSVSPAISNCVIEDNNAADSGGGIYCYCSSPIITNCVFTGNDAYCGGAIDIAPEYEGTLCQPVIVNCLFTENTANGGGAIVFDIGYYSQAELTNCTFCANYAPYGLYRPAFLRPLLPQQV